MTSKCTVEFERICADPSAHYKTPEAVASDPCLTRDQKIQLLKLWAFDAQEIETAQQENMQAERNGTGLLHQILVVLHEVEGKA